MPKFNKRSIKTINIKHIESFPAPDEHVSSEFQSVEYVEDRMRRYGLQPYEIALVVAKHVEEKSFSEIAREQNWTSKGACAWHLKQALLKLKERGFKLK